MVYHGLLQLQRCVQGCASLKVSKQLNAFVCVLLCTRETTVLNFCHSFPLLMRHGADGVDAEA